jgi:hypothetical protein
MKTAHIHAQLTDRGCLARDISVTMRGEVSHTVERGVAHFSHPEYSLPMDAFRPEPIAALPGQSVTLFADMLESRITHARIRMLYGHMPVTAWTLVGFIIVIGGLIHFMVPGRPALPMLAWLMVALMLAVTRALHAQSYFRSADRQAPFWQHSYFWLTLVFSVCWSALPWALPFRSDQQLAIAIIGVMVGMAATGTAQISSDRANVRAWTRPSPSVPPRAVFWPP